jgi:hypothetical protein
MKVLLGKYISKTTIGDKSSHQISYDYGVLVLNLATKKIDC